MADLSRNRWPIPPEYALYDRINAQLIPGSGTSTQRHEYSFLDNGLLPETYSYMLESVATDGSHEQFGPVHATVMPASLTLAVGPNPVRGDATLSFTMPRTDSPSIVVYDVGGRMVHAIDPGTLPAGDHSVTWNCNEVSGSRLPAGTYLCRIAAESGAVSALLVLTR